MDRKSHWFRTSWRVVTLCCILGICDVNWRSVHLFQVCFSYSLICYILILCFHMYYFHRWIPLNCTHMVEEKQNMSCGLEGERGNMMYSSCHWGHQVCILHGERFLFCSIMHRGSQWEDNCTHYVIACSCFDFAHIQSSSVHRLICVEVYVVLCVMACALWVLLIWLQCTVLQITLQVLHTPWETGFDKLLAYLLANASFCLCHCKR